MKKQDTDWEKNVWGVGQWVSLKKHTNVFRTCKTDSHKSISKRTQ